MSKIKSIDELESENSHLKQVAFKLQGDVETARWENAQKNIAFLKEMKGRLEKYHSKKDATEIEMVYTMIDDWVHELEQR